MISEFNKKEQDALIALEAAFKLCKQAKISMSVMDGKIIAVNNNTYKECLIVQKEKERGSQGAYPACAYSQDTKTNIDHFVNAHGCIDDCGGW